MVVCFGAGSLRRWNDFFDGTIPMTEDFALAKSGYRCDDCNTMTDNLGWPTMPGLWPETCNKYAYITKVAHCVADEDFCNRDCVGAWSEWSTCDTTSTSAFSEKEQRDCVEWFNPVCSWFIVVFVCVFCVQPRPLRAHAYVYCHR